MTKFPMIETIEDIEAIERTHWRDHCSFKSTYEAIIQSSEQYGDTPAIVYLPNGLASDDPHEISYRELAAQITQTANLFYSLGVGPTDIVSYILPNFPETHEIIWGGEAAGIVNAINPFLEPETIQALLSAAQSKVLVATPPLPGINLWEPIVAIADQLDHIEVVIFVDPAEYYGLAPIELPSKTESGKPILRFQDARDAQNGTYLDSGRAFEPSDIASLFHTGGTTGTPKLAPHTHENEVFNAWAISRVTPIEVGEKVLAGLPLFHVNAVIVTGLASLVSGSTQVMLGPLGFRGPGVIQDIWQNIARHKAVSMSGVPTIYSAMMSVPKEGLDLSSFRFAAVGAAPLSPELFRNFVAYAGVELLEGYGLTESTVVAAMNPLGGEKRIGSIGLRLPHLEMKCAELDERGDIIRLCDENEIGTIIIRGPSVFPGYYNHEEAGLSGDGWLNTGDLGRQDEDGYFWLTGRSKDVIIRGGHNIDPSMIENTLEAHEAVALAAAVGQPDAYAGELPAAYVQLQPGAKIDPAELKSWAKSEIPERAAAPVYLEIMDALPVTAVGKIHKPTLRSSAIKRIVHETLEQAGINAELEIISDPKRGTLARIYWDDEPKVREILGCFAFTFDVASATISNDQSS